MRTTLASLGQSQPQPQPQPQTQPQPQPQPQPQAGIILEAKAKRDSTPVDKDSNTCISITLLPPALTTSYISSLKDSLLSNMEVDSAARKKKMDDLNDERAEDLTEELEERLRLHWPRKGRTEVKSRQPREGELVSHRQKSARFLRQFYQRLGEQEEEFGRLVGRVEGHSDEFSTAVRALGETLKEMGSLAALQGQEMKCKVRLILHLTRTNHEDEDEDE